MRIFSCIVLSGWFALGCGGAASSGGAGGAGASGGTSTSSGAGGSTASTGTGTASGGAGGAGTSSATASSTGPSSSSASSGGTGGSSLASGDCLSDINCPGGSCVEVTPGGFRVCLIPPPKAISCSNPGLDQCCGSMPCPKTESCYEGPLVPFCAGAQMLPYNQCAVDQCSQDADCVSGQVCALAGTLGLKIRACIDAMCKVDADCAAHPGGVCAPVQQPCCAATAGLYCTYPVDGCRTGADCPSSPAHPSRYCAPNLATGVASCQDGSPVCPQ